MMELRNHGTMELRNHGTVDSWKHGNGRPRGGQSAHPVGLPGLMAVA